MQRANKLGAWTSHPTRAGFQTDGNQRQSRPLKGPGKSTGKYCYGENGAEAPRTKEGWCEGCATPDHSHERPRRSDHGRPRPETNRMDMSEALRKRSRSSAGQPCPQLDLALPDGEPTNACCFSHPSRRDTAECPGQQTAATRPQKPPWLLAAPGTLRCAWHTRQRPCTAARTQPAPPRRAGLRRRRLHGLEPQKRHGGHPRTSRAEHATQHHSRGRSGGEGPGASTPPRGRTSVPASSPCVSRTLREQNWPSPQAAPSESRADRGGLFLPLQTPLLEPHWMERESRSGNRPHGTSSREPCGPPGSA